MQPFLNYMKVCQNFQTRAPSRSGDPFPGTLTNDMYPKDGASLAYDLSCVISMGSSANRTTDWYIDLKGQLGTNSREVGLIIQHHGGSSCTVISDPQNCVVAPCNTQINLTGRNCAVRFRFPQPTTSFTVFLKATGKFSGIRDLRIYRADQKAHMDAGELFNPDFVALIQAIKPKALRFLDWYNVNFSNNTNDAYIPSMDALTWNSNTFAAGAWAGIVSGTDTYAVGNSPDSNPAAYVDGEVIQVYFANGNASTTPTLNRNGLGPKTIVTSNGGPMQGGFIKPGSVVTMIYDGLLDKYMWSGNFGFRPSAPVIVSIALCNAIPADCWLHIPHMFSDSAAQRIVETARDNLDPGLKLYVEYGNEIWNFAFDQTYWAIARGKALGIPEARNQALHSYYGLKLAQLMPLVTSTWTAKRAAGDLYRVMAVQAQAGSTASGLTNTYRLLGTDLCGTSCGNAKYQAIVGVDHNAAPNRPVDFIDVGSFAPYVSGYQFAAVDSRYRNPIDPNALAAADSYAAGGAENIASALAYVDDDLRNDVAGFTFSLAYQDNVLYPGWGSLFGSYGKTIAQYEGGYEGWYPSARICTSRGISATYCGQGGKIDLLLRGYRSDDRFRAAMRDNFAKFVSNSPGGSLPSWYTLGPGYSRWSILSGDIYSPAFKSKDAVANFDHGR